MLTALRITRSALPFDEVYARLYEWARWANSHWPHLGVQEPPYAAEWYPSLAWDSGWGDVVPPDSPPPRVDEKRAEQVDKAVPCLAREHRNLLKHIYVTSGWWRHIWKLPDSMRIRLDAAVRALGDRLE